MVALRLPGNNLTSTLLTLDGFESLRHLAVLDLSGNALSGSPPLQTLIALIDEPGVLRSLDLDGNAFDYGEGGTYADLLWRCRIVMPSGCGGLPPSGCSAFGAQYQPAVEAPDLCTECEDYW